MNLHKFVLTYFKYSPFFNWYRLMIHKDYQLDNPFKYRYQDFWNSLNDGYSKMVEDHKWLTYFGAKPETIYLSQKDYDALVERLNEPSDPAALESIKKIMVRKAPWD